VSGEVAALGGQGLQGLQGLQGSRGAGPRGAWERGGCAESEEGGGSWVSSAGEVYSNIFAQGRAKQCDARKGVAGREGARHLCRE